MRQVYVKEKHGGTCITESFQERKKGDKEDILRQTEDCKLCKEHCQPDIIEFEQLPYPHPENPNCVGYCPIDCDWENPEHTQDCKKEIEEYFKETNYGEGKAQYASGCYLSKAVQYLDREKRGTESHELVKNFQAIIAKIKAYKGDKIKKDVVRKIKAKEQSSLAKMYQLYEEGDEVINEIWDNLEDRFDDDVKDLVKLLESKTEKLAKVPVLDGLYGGKACQRRTPDNKYLTIRKDDDPKYDKNTMTNAKPMEYSYVYDACHIDICGAISNEFEPGYVPTKIPCQYFSWSEWGNWGKCNIKCGPEGKRKRRRKCMNTCKDEEAEDQCKPYFNNIMNRTFTDTDRAECTPCPADELSFWSEWADWELLEGEKCGTGVRIEQRRRKCVAAKDGTMKCEGKDKETKEFHLKPCPPPKGGSNSEYSYGGESDSGMEEGENPSTEEGANDDGGMVVNDNDGAGGEYPGADGDENGEGGGEGDAGADGEDATYPGAGPDSEGGDGAAGEDGDDGAYPSTDEPADSNMGEDNTEAGHDYADEYDTTESEDYN